MAYVKIEITIFTDRWDTYAKDSTVIGFNPKEKLKAKDVTTSTRDLMIRMTRKAKDDNNQEKEENDIGHSSRRSQTAEEEAEEASK